MARYFSSDFTLGILGGGQLGKMLLYETRKYDIRTIVLDPSAEAPCHISCNEFYQGSLTDFDTVYQFGKKADVLTIEIEHVNVEALERLELEGIKVYPSPKTLRKIQDKGTQKQFYSENEIPTSPFQLFDNRSSLKKYLNEVNTTLPVVWKQCAGGYDGMGVLVIKELEQLEDLPDVPCILEEYVPFKNELAVIVARNLDGQIVTYPVVEMEFHPEANKVEYVICPARIDETVAEKAREIAKQVSGAFGHVGLLAVEMFQTQENNIIVNEVAPRPHNSGHFSIEASYTNQFEQHLRSILNLPLGSTKSKLNGIMVNLVGSEGHTGDVVYKNIDEIMAMDGVSPHIYGKKETRPFRKMGHVTIINDNIEVAHSIAERVKETIQVISK
jgi:5-(carboxyamino)imidazole ribonucleotide synthase